MRPFRLLLALTGMLLGLKRDGELKDLEEPLELSLGRSPRQESRTKSPSDLWEELFTMSRDVDSREGPLYPI